MRRTILEPLEKAQDEIFRLTGKCLPIYVAMCDRDFEEIYAEVSRGVIRPYRYTTTVQIGPSIFACRESARMV